MAKATTAGYSGAPLAKKLGFKEGASAWTLGAPDDYMKLLAPIPSGVEFARSPSVRTDLVHVFVSQTSVLKKELARLRKLLRPDATLWVSWPKKASKVPTDITEDTIRSLALPMGFVDVKVCAVNEVWSGLKLVVRRSLRIHDA
jgi:hypothetical protein